MTDPLRELARKIASLEAAKNSTRPQLGSSSLEDGAIREYDLDGTLVSQYGKQFDGTSAAAAFNGPPPPTPTQPVVEGGLSGLSVTWDGTFLNDAIVPMNFSRVEVYVSTDPTFDYGSGPQHSFETPRGGRVFVGPLPISLHYVWLVSRNFAGVPSAPSLVATGTPSNEAHQAALDAAAAQVAAAQAALDAAQAQLDAAQAAVDAAAASVTANDANLAAAAAAVDANDAAVAAAAAQVTADNATTIGNDAATDAASAVSTANAASAAVATKAGQYVQASPPTGLSAIDKATWISTSEDNKIYTWNGSAWVAMPLGTQAISDAAITGSKITSGAIDNSKMGVDSVTGTNITNGAISDTELAANAVVAGKIAAAAVGSTQLADAAVVAGKIAANAVTSTTITDDAITSPKIAANAVTASEIQAGAVTAGKVAADAIGANEIVAGSITSDELAAFSVIAGKIAAGSVSTGELAADSVTAVKLAAGSVVAGKIAADAVTANEIAAGSITTSELAALAVTAAKIAANTITAAQIAAGTITATELAALSVTAGKIAAGAITATEIQAGAITTAKIGAGQVTANEIAADTITAAKIATGAITADELAAASVIAGKVAAGVITATEIAAGAITTAKIQAGAVTATEIATDAITASKIQAGAVTASAISADAINGRTITGVDIIGGSIKTANPAPGTGSVIVRPGASTSNVVNSTLVDAVIEMRSGTTDEQYPAEFLAFGDGDTAADNLSLQIWAPTKASAPSSRASMQMFARKSDGANSAVFLTADSVRLYAIQGSLGPSATPRLSWDSAGKITIPGDLEVSGVITQSGGNAKVGFSGNASTTIPANTNWGSGTPTITSGGSRVTAGLDRISFPVAGVVTLNCFFYMANSSNHKFAWVTVPNFSEAFRTQGDWTDKMTLSYRAVVAAGETWFFGQYLADASAGTTLQFTGVWEPL